MGQLKELRMLSKRAAQLIDYCYDMGIKRMESGLTDSEKELLDDYDREIDYIRKKIDDAGYDSTFFIELGFKDLEKENEENEEEDEDLCQEQI